MAEARDHVTKVLRDLQDAGSITGMPVEPSEGFSKNIEAGAIFGLRRTDCTYIDHPCELGYHCPACQYPQVSDGNYDERLFWSEYESFIWCAVCNRDYPSCLCLPGNPQRAIEVFLSSVKGALERHGPAKAPAKEILMHKFWMVYRVGHGTPQKMHETPQLAVAEAKRLCQKEGAEFVVLEAMALVRPAEPKMGPLTKRERE
jgi:hypothetical protein